MPAVYLAGPISHETYDDVTEWRNQVTVRLVQIGFRVLNPMRGKEALRDVGLLKPTGYAAEGILSGKSLVRRDLGDIVAADAVIINFAGAREKSLGSIAELGYARGKGKHVVVVMSADDIHDHIFVHELADVVVETLDEAISWLRTLYEAYL